MREKIDNNLKNAHKNLAMVVEFQKSEIVKLAKLIPKYQKKYDEEMAILDNMEVGSEERAEQQEIVDRYANVLYLNEEALAQYQMNLKELNVL